MKITDLLDLLEATLVQHGDIEVLCTWDGTENGIDRDDVFVGYHTERRRGRPDVFWKVLFIDCDCMSYKDLQMKRPKIGEEVDRMPDE